MGTRAAFIGIKEIWSDQIIHVLDLEPIKAEDAWNRSSEETRVSLVELAERRWLISDLDWKIVEDNNMLAQLSKLGPTYTVGVVDSCCYSEASAWSEGQMLWKISYLYDEGKFKVTGNPPDVYADLRSKFVDHYKITEDESTTTWCELAKYLFYNYTGYWVDRTMIPQRAFKYFKKVR